ncbi:MAG: DUF523 domain-containing protein [Candidatus Schekmanbacteria bacterium]|nr:DUF523 domain-containing protein [Candidatus Schekmanbacteria bacterium]
MDERVKIGISSCLLGKNVRYDGGHKLDKCLIDAFEGFAEWVPVCPEVECGLSVPREEMKLAGTSDSPHLVTVNTNIDYTQLMQEWMEKRLAVLENENLCGFIFKSNSPSCALYGIKIFNESRIAETNGTGIFASKFIKHFPSIPVEDEKRLQDEEIRGKFLARILKFARQ